MLPDLRVSVGIHRQTTERNAVLTASPVESINIVTPATAPHTTGENSIT